MIEKIYSDIREYSLNKDELELSIDIRIIIIQRYVQVLFFAPNIDSPIVIEPSGKTILPSSKYKTDLKSTVSEVKDWLFNNKDCLDWLVNKEISGNDFVNLMFKGTFKVNNIQKSIQKNIKNTLKRISYE